MISKKYDIIFPAYRIRTDDQQITTMKQLQSAALPTELKPVRLTPLYY